MLCDALKLHFNEVNLRIAVLFDSKNGRKGSQMPTAVLIEDVEYLLDQDTITVAEIRSSGNIPSDQVVIQEEPDGSE